MSTPPSSNRLLLLQRIRDASSRIQSRCTSSRATGLCSPQPAIVPAWDFDTILPCTNPITPELEALGIDPDTASEFSAAYTWAASRLKCLYENLLRKSYSESDSSNPQDRSSLLLCLNSAFSEKYQSGLQQSKETTIRMSRLAVSRNTAASSYSNKTRHAFNQDSVPLLEKYFEYNNYPSAADRAMLARKAGLTLRQVEVWFQNHRNRAKKAGKPMKRLRYDEFPYDFTLEGLAEKAPSLKKRSRKQSPEACPTIPEPPAAKPQSAPILRVSPTRSGENILDVVKPPPHAFPASFQPLDHSNSLHQSPCNQLEWYRHPAKKLLRRTIPTVDELCESFQFSLNLRKQSKRSHVEAFVEGETPTTSWFPATYTTLPSTRHPALVARQNCSQMLQPQLLNDLSSLCPSQQCSEPRGYSPLPRRSEVTGFLKYQHQTAKFGELPPTYQDTPHQLRRRSSTSSVDSSVGCSTPISSPIAHIHLLPDVFEDTLSLDALQDPDTLLFSKKLRSQINSNIYTPCNLTPPLLYSV